MWCGYVFMSLVKLFFAFFDFLTTMKYFLKSEGVEERESGKEGLIDLIIYLFNMYFCFFDGGNEKGMR